MLFQAEEALSTAKMFNYHKGIANVGDKQDASRFKKTQKMHLSISKLVNSPSAQAFPDQVRWRNSSKISFCYH